MNEDEILMEVEKIEKEIMLRINDAEDRTAIYVTGFISTLDAILKDNPYRAMQFAMAATQVINHVMAEIVNKIGADKETK